MVYRFRVRRVRWRLGISLLLLFAFISIGGGISLYGENATSGLRPHGCSEAWVQRIFTGEPLAILAAWMLLFYYRRRSRSS